MLGQDTEEPNTVDTKNISDSDSIPYLSQRISIQITLIAVFAALAIGSSYMLAPFINIEVMSVLLFISGFIFGKYVGGLVGLISSVIYYGWNPFGVPALPLYLACVGCMTFIGFVGGILKTSQAISKRIEMNPLNILKLALVGFCYTLLFDLITNVIYAIFYYGGDIRLAFITGLPFMIIHIVSNTVIFAFLIIPVHNTVISIH